MQKNCQIAIMQKIIIFLKIAKNHGHDFPEGQALTMCMCECYRSWQTVSTGLSRQSESCGASWVSVRRRTTGSRQNYRSVHQTQLTLILGQFGPKWDKSRTCSHQISVHFGLACPNCGQYYPPCAQIIPPWRPFKTLWWLRLCPRNIDLNRLVFSQVSRKDDFLVINNYRLKYWNIVKLTN